MPAAHLKLAAAHAGSDPKTPPLAPCLKMEPRLIGVSRMGLPIAQLGTGTGRNVMENWQFFLLLLVIWLAPAADHDHGFVKFVTGVWLVLAVLAGASKVLGS